MVLLAKGRDLAGGFASYPSALKPSDPHRDPGPGRVAHLHHHAPVALCDHPTTQAANQLVARLNIEHQSLWGASHAHQMEALQTDEQITPITTIKRHGAAAGRVRHRPRSCEDRGGRSPLTIKDLDLYPQPPTNTHSPTLNSEEPDWGPSPGRRESPRLVDGNVTARQRDRTLSGRVRLAWPGRTTRPRQAPPDGRPPRPHRCGGRRRVRRRPEHQRSTPSSPSQQAGKPPLTLRHRAPGGPCS